MIRELLTREFPTRYFIFVVLLVGLALSACLALFTPPTAPQLIDHLVGRAFAAGEDFSDGATP